MSTKTGNMRWAILSGVVGTVIALWAVGSARADVASDEPGAILIYPKIFVDTHGVFGPPTDTEIQVTNTSNSVIGARCFLVNATSFCSNSPDPTDPIACTPETEGSPEHRCPPGGFCLQQWTENDFKMTLTKRQPVSWKASEGRDTFPCDEQGKSCFGGQTNAGSFAIATQTDPFFGELKCVEVDPASFEPVIGFNPANSAHGDLKGEATIVSDVPGRIDARKYNAIALQSTGVNDNNDTLLVGGPGAEYNGCPNVLILNHLFDDAEVDTHESSEGNPMVPSSIVRTDLTVVPCGEDFNTQTPNTATLQFLVFNEFEQRFSTSTNVTCFREVPLSDIDTRPGPFGDHQSIFNVNVSGTLAGQTRIRAVSGASTDNRVLAVAEEFMTCGSGPEGVCSAAANVHFTGSQSPKGDLIQLSPDLP